MLHAVCCQQGDATQIGKHYRTCCLWKATGDSVCEFEGHFPYLGYNLVALVVTGWWLDLMILEVFSNLNDSINLWIFKVKFLANLNGVHLACHPSITGCKTSSQQGRAYLHISVWWTVGRKWKTWLLTARLCSSRKGSRTTPSLTGNVRRSSSLWLAGIEEGEKAWTFPLASAVQ